MASFFSIQDCFSLGSLDSTVAGFGSTGNIINILPTIFRLHMCWWWCKPTLPQSSSPSLRVLLHIATEDNIGGEEGNMKFGTTLKNCRHLLECAKELDVQIIGVKWVFCFIKFPFYGINLLSFWWQIFQHFICMKSD